MQTVSARSWPRVDLTALAVAGAVVVIAAALIALPPLFGAALVFGAALGIVVIARPLWGFYLLLLSIPVQDLGARGEFTLTNALFGLTLLAWLLRRAVAGARPLPRGVVGPLFVVFVCGLTLSLIVAQDLAPGVAALFQWLKALAVYFLALDLLRTRRKATGALVALLLAGAAEGAYGLFQYATGAGPASFAIGDQFSRAYGTFGKPNSYAGYLEMLLPPGLIFAGWAWRNRPGSAKLLDRFGRLALVGAVALIGGALLASFSRGAWLGISAGLGAMILLTSPRARGIAATSAVAVGILGVLGGVALLPASVRDRFDSILGNAGSPDVRTAYITAENFAVVERLAHWAAGLNMFRSDIWLGVGLGNFNVRYTDFNVSPTFLVSQGHAHNYYIHVAAEAGIVGLGTYLLLLAAIVGTGLHALRVTSAPGHDPLARGLVIACLGTVVAVAIHNIFENLHVLSMGIQLSTIWALLTIVTQPAWRGSGTPATAESSAASTGTSEA
jgi:putative inorganic carbon (HCO3(-)) transporter